MRRLLPLLLACAACSGTQAPPPPLPSAPASATAPSTSASPPAATTGAARPIEPFWEIIGGLRVVHVRDPSGACEAWRTEPAGAVADYTGVLSHEIEGSPKLRLTLDYASDDARAVRLSAPRAKRGDRSFTFLCEGGPTTPLYATEEACRAGGASELNAEGCLGVLLDPARREALGAPPPPPAPGTLEQAFARAIHGGARVWILGHSKTKTFCREHVLKGGSRGQFFEASSKGRSGYDYQVHRGEIALTGPWIKEETPDEGIGFGGYLQRSARAVTTDYIDFGESRWYLREDACARAQRLGDVAIAGI